MIDMKNKVITNGYGDIGVGLASQTTLEIIERRSTEMSMKRIRKVPEFMAYLKSIEDIEEGLKGFTSECTEMKKLRDLLNTESTKEKRTKIKGHRATLQLPRKSPKFYINGDLVTEARKEKGMTSAAVSKELGFAESWVSHFVNGRALQIEGVEMIARYFNLNTEDIIVAPARKDMDRDEWLRTEEGRTSTWTYKTLETCPTQ